MRLSVRGLAGKPVRLDDALADWRAETMVRLTQAKIEAVWNHPDDGVSQTLPARVFMQLTRILREAVSNVIKHSSATHCEVRCAVLDGELQVTVQGRRPRHRRRSPARPGHVEHEAACQENERPMPGRVASQATAS